MSLTALKRRRILKVIPSHPLRFTVHRNWLVNTPSYIYLASGAKPFTVRRSAFTVGLEFWAHKVTERRTPNGERRQASPRKLRDKAAINLKVPPIEGEDLFDSGFAPGCCQQRVQQAFPAKTKLNQPAQEEACRFRAGENRKYLFGVPPVGRAFNGSFDRKRGCESVIVGHHVNEFCQHLRRQSQSVSTRQNPVAATSHPSV
jgi:hypothetical protein